MRTTIRLLAASAPLALIAAMAMSSPAWADGTAECNSADSVGPDGIPGNADDITGATECGVNATALGNHSTATGASSQALGANGTATGFHSVAFNANSTATGASSEAGGVNSTA